MKIIEVTYSLQTHRDEEDAFCSACAVVNENEEKSPEQVFDELRVWVHQRLSLHEEVEQLDEKKRSLESDLAYMREVLRRASFAWREIEAQWAKAKAFLEQHGLEVTEALPVAPNFDLEEEPVCSAVL